MPYRGFVQEEASTAQRRWVGVLCALILMSMAIVAPWASEPLPALPHISGMYGAATAMVDLATFWLLISTPHPHRAHVIVAAGYLFAGLMAILHVLTFPGAVLADTPVVGSPHAVSWLFIAWRAGFGAFVIWAIVAESDRLPGRIPDRIPDPVSDRTRAGDRPGEPPGESSRGHPGERPGERPSERPGERSDAWPLVAAFLAVVALALSSQLSDLGALTPDGERMLFGPVSRFGAYLSVAAALVAVLLSWRRGLFRRAIYVWLAFVLVAEGAGVWLSTHGGQRYSVAWYLARVEGLLANMVMLGVVAVHLRAVQKRLTLAYQTLHQRTEELQTQVQKREVAEAQLARAQKLDAVGRVGASLAHDLNNILQVLTGRLAIVRKRAGEGVDADVQVMRRSVKKAEALTRQLTLLSGQRRNQPRPLQLAPVLQEMEDALRSLMGTQCQLDISAAQDLPWVALDPLELEIAVTNLATNAFDAMKHGGRLRIKAFRTTTPDVGQGVAIEVADEGEGIRPEIREKVFEPFFTTKSRGQGTGLGLAQVQAFVAGSGGEVQLRSEPGQGTAFTMIFPATEVEAPSRQDPQEIAHQEPQPHPQLRARALQSRRDFSGKVLLLVEDNPDVRDASHQLLSAEGLAVHAVGDAHQALALLDSGFSADFLASDIVMPGSMDGVDLARAVKARFPAIRTVLVTGYSETAERAREEGFTVLRKPYDLSSLVEALA